MAVLLLLPTSSYRVSDFLRAAERLDVEVVVASEQASTMEPLQREHLLTLDFSRPEEAADRVLRFHRDRPIDAVVSVDEETAVVAAAVAARLGLPHHSPEAAKRARLKHLMREALAAAGVPSPRHRLARTSDSPAGLAREVEAEIGFPVVLKPVFLSGSRGVARADHAEAFVSAFDRLRRLLESEALRSRGGEDAERLLVEAFVAGREVAVEALVADGRLTPLAVFDKPDPLEGPYFEETIYVTPSRLPRAVQKSLLEVTSRAALALGLRHGPIHAELRLPENGPPCVIEIAGRSIGGLCSRTLRFGLGSERTLEEVILEHAVGRDVTGLGDAAKSKGAGVMMIPIPRAGILESVAGLEDARRVPDIEDVTLTAHLGQELVPLPEGSSYLGFIFARSDSPERSEAALREAHAKLTFVVR